tara:strand:- start:408 stop:1136 length:729 start_codon:yes stop_codon:yes gene_type:complete
MKDIFHLCGYMRCGNTVLSSIVNQNPELTIAPNSIIPEMVYNMYLLQEQSIYNEQKDEQSFKNVLSAIPQNYFKDWKAKTIIDRGPWSTPANYDLLKYMGCKTKFIYIVRPLKEILESFCRVARPKPHHVENFIAYLMNENGPIGKSVLGLQNLKEKKEKNLLILNYHDFCKQPEKVVKELYKFLKIPYYKKHRYTDLEQIDGSTEQTKIRTKKVEFVKHKFLRKVPLEVVKKYEKSFISSL